jgi:hypothetical protein
MNMAGKNTAAFGIYSTRAAVESAVDTLKAEGYRNTDISVLFLQNAGTKDFAHEKNTKDPEAAPAVAVTGAVIGGTLGWLGISALAIPGLGPFIAAGPMIAALAGSFVGGAVGEAAGEALRGITGALIGMGIPEHEARRYEERIKSGGILLSVHCDNPEWTKKAKELLENTGAEDVSSTGEAAADFSKSDRTMPRTDRKIS